MNILIVDDSPTALLHSRFYLEEAATRHGRNVTIETAGDGEMALEMARQQNIDLIVLDIQLPGISGFDVCSTIKASDARTRVAFVSGSADDDTLNQARACAGDYFIKKPISVDSFDDILAQ